MGGGQSRQPVQAADDAGGATLVPGENGTAPRLSQDETQVTYATLLSKEDGRLNWADSAQNLHNRARAVNPWPGAWCEWKEDYCRTETEPLKIWRTQVIEGNYGGAIPGAILQVKDDAMLVQTGDGILKILEVQSPGKPRMNPESWARGHHAGSGKKFD